MKCNVVISLVPLFAFSIFAASFPNADTDINRDDLLAHLPLTNDVKDISIHRHETDTEGTIEIREGAAWFAGNGSWIELPHVALNNRAFAIALWIKVTGSKNSYGILEQQSERAPHEHLHIMLRGASQPYFGFLNDDAMSPTDVSVNEWTHLVFQFNGSEQQIWINGQLACLRRAAPYGGNAGLTRLGRAPRWSNVPAHDFEGAMRDVRIYARALSFDEIVRLSGKTAESGAVPLLQLEGKMLTISGHVGEIYELEASFNSENGWKRLALLTNRTGRVTCVDPLATGKAERFYRIQTH